MKSLRENLRQHSKSVIVQKRGSLTIENLERNLNLNEKQLSQGGEEEKESTQMQIISTLEPSMTQDDSVKNSMGELIFKSLGSMVTDTTRELETLRMQQ